ncbi:hypothetical protein C8R45DRAFT_1047363, partial [Mycena sanguinolenta]
MHHVLATASSESLTRALLWRDRCLSRRSQPNPDAVCDMCGIHLHYQPAPFLFLCGELKPALAVCVASTFRTSAGCLASLELSRESGKTRIRNGFGTFLSRLHLPARSAAVTRFHHCGALLQASSYTEAPLAVHRVILLADSRGRAAAAAAAVTGREARRRQSQISAVVRHPSTRMARFTTRLQVPLPCTARFPLLASAHHMNTFARGLATTAAPPDAQRRLDAAGVLIGAQLQS